jgi:hypothetical protein
MTPYGVDDKEVWLLILQHLYNSSFQSLAARLERELTARQVLPDVPRTSGTRARVIESLVTPSRQLWYKYLLVAEASSGSIAFFVRGARSYPRLSATLSCNVLHVAHFGS